MNIHQKVVLLEMDILIIVGTSIEEKSI